MASNKNVVALLEPVIYNTVNNFATSSTALSDTVRSNASKCVSGFQQSLGIVIQNANLLVTGNFEARQKATLVMSCVSPFLADPSAKSALQSALTTAIADELAKNSITNVSNDAISASVAKNIDGALTECRDDGGNQRIASGGSIHFTGTIKIGVCTEEKLNSATADCVGGDATKQAAGCQALANCLKKEGNFIFESGANIRSECSAKLYQIALDIAKAASPTTPPPGATDGGSSSFWSTKNILIGAAIAAAIILLVVVIIVLLSRNKGAATPLTPYYQSYPSAPISYTQPYY